MVGLQIRWLLVSALHAELPRTFDLLIESGAKTHPETCTE